MQRKKADFGKVGLKYPLILYGAPEATRTPGTGIRNPLLYPPELRGHSCFLTNFSFFFKLKMFAQLTLFGGGSPLKNAIKLSAAIIAILSLTSLAALPI